MAIIVELFFFGTFFFCQLFTNMDKSTAVEAIYVRVQLCDLGGGFILPAPVLSLGRK